MGVAATALLSRRFPAAVDRGDRACAQEARSRLGIRTLAGWSASARIAFHRWAPVVLLLPGLEGWSRSERAALGDVIRAKGGRRESDFVQLFDAHPRLPGALALLARRSENA